MSLIDREESFSAIQQYLVSSAIALFDAYGVPVTHLPGRRTEVMGPAVMAVIGYASVNLRGSLLLLAPRSVVLTLKPSEVNGVPVEDVLRDVFGEFANMLLGRVKNRLSERQIEPLITTPTTLFGEGVVLPVPTSGMSAWHTFESQGGPIFVRFDATFEDGFTFGPVNEGAREIVEGEMILFGDTETEE